jgi:hypothetical protein
MRDRSKLIAMPFAVMHEKIYLKIMRPVLVVYYPHPMFIFFHTSEKEKRLNTVVVLWWSVSADF